MRKDFEEAIQDLDDTIEALDDANMPDANILVAGITGTGKSTLLNAVFGSEAAKTGTGKPVTDELHEYNDPNVPIHIWDTVGLELDSAKTEKSINDIRKAISEKALSENQFDRIHAIWYCINSGSNRYQGAELDFIKALHDIGVPFIIVLTQCTDIEEKINAFEETIRRINAENGMSDIDVVQVCAKEFQTRLGIIPAFGLEDLVNITLKRLPKYIKEGFIAAQRVSKDDKRKLCEENIIKKVNEAYTGFWDKVPLINIVLTNTKITDLLSETAKIYNTILDDSQLDQIQQRCRLDPKNAFNGLVNPFNKEYNSDIDRLFNSKKQEGLKVEAKDLPKEERAARLIAFYGYTFIDAVEEVWEIINNEELDNMDIIIEKLVEKINEHLANNKSKRVKKVGI